VIHVASPSQLEGSDEEIIKPALEGTKAVLKACRDFELKKCIFTSSFTAISGGKNVKSVYNEDDWADENFANVNDKSKIMAEKLVWKFKDELPKDSKLELVSINPGLIIGISSCK
jgi:dihydroflavonol-4-reductase